MTFPRIIGLVLFAAALLFVVAGALTPADGDGFTVERLWRIVSASSLSFAETLIERHFWSGLWDFGIWPILAAPAWSVCATLGAVFFIFGRPRTAGR